MFEGFLFKIVCFLSIITLLLLIGFFLTKIAEWFEKRKASRYKSDKAEFISNLYTLTQKWSKRGRTDYAAGLFIIINELDTEKEQDPQTAYGAMIKRSLKDAEEFPNNNNEEE